MCISCLVCYDLMVVVFNVIGWLIVGCVGLVYCVVYIVCY